MAVGTTNFPTALDTVITLIEAANNAASTLSGAIDDSVTTITVASTGSFAASGVIAIENELISYTAKTATDFTGCTRGFEGTAAASHLDTTAVEQLITARSHNVLASAIIATQTKLGYGSDTPANGQALIGNGAGTSEWRALIAGDIPDLSGTYATTGHNHSGVYQPVDADLTAIAALSNDGLLRKTGGTWGMDSATYLTANQSISLSGDVTGTGTTAITATIANDAVTYAKLQNVSATSRILGRKTALAGDAEECTLSEVLDFIGSAAQGDILYRGASAWARLGAGTSGHYLQTQGAGANPQWAAAGGGSDAVVFAIALG